MNEDASPRRDTPEVSLQDLQAAAERGDPAAMYNLGLLYSKGQDGIPQDYVAALRWLDKAAKKKFPPAYYALGIHHFNGLGVRLSRKNGLGWYFKAARAGVPDAMFQMGLCLQKGIECRPDLDKALFWFRKASDAGLPAAAYKLGTLHSQGVEGQVDEALAVKYWKKAAAAGHPQALFNIGMCLINGYAGTPYDPLKAVCCWELAAAHKSPEAMRELGQACLNGPRTPERNAHAVKWFLLEDAVRHSPENPIFTRKAEFTEAELDAGLRLMGEWVNNPDTRLSPEFVALLASLDEENRAPDDSSAHPQTQGPQTPSSSPVLTPPPGTALRARPAQPPKRR